MDLHQALDQGQLASMPETLHGMAGMQSPVLIVPGDGMIIERQITFSYSYFPCRSSRRMANRFRNIWMESSTSLTRLARWRSIICTATGWMLYFSFRAT